MKNPLDKGRFKSRAGVRGRQQSRTQLSKIVESKTHVGKRGTKKTQRSQGKERKEFHTSKISLRPSYARETTSLITLLGAHNDGAHRIPAAAKQGQTRGPSFER